MIDRASTQKKKERYRSSMTSSIQIIKPYLVHSTRLYSSFVLLRFIAHSENQCKIIVEIQFDNIAYLNKRLAHLSLEIGKDEFPFLTFFSCSKCRIPSEHIKSVTITILFLSICSFPFFFFYLMYRVLS